jgi:hypothetical protein
MTPMPARIIHTTIDRPWRDVYAFASQPENMPRWAAGLAAGLSREGEDWIGDGGPIGKIRVRFTPLNDLGVIDHTVTLDTGMSFENALRVVPNGDGAEIMFTLLRQPDTDDQAFEVDAAAIQTDLSTLKHILEQS